MNPVLAAQLRRQWPLVTAFVAFLLFLVVHFTLFQGSLHRYQTAVKRAGDMGVALDPQQSPRMMPARVFALLSDNALPTAVADAQSASGELSARLLEEVTRLASQHRMDVAVTEPGATVQLPNAVQVRAHIRVNCSYRAFVSFLDDLSRTGTLISVDRFILTSSSGGQHTLDVWVTRYLLKQPGDRS